MRQGRLLTSVVGRVAAVARRHLADPTFYARRYRASRLGGSASTYSRDSAGAPFAIGTSRLRAWSRSTLRRLAARQANPPGAFERWIARPAVFTTAVLIGSIAVAATFDTARTASMALTLIPACSVIVVWVGLTGMMSYTEERWPRVRRALLGAWAFTSFATAVAGIVLVRRAISLPLVQLGLWSMISAIAALFASSPADGDA